MDTEHLGTLSAALVKKIEGAPQSTFLPATVVSYDSASNLVTLSVDGDEGVIPVVSLIGAVLPGERVMVQFSPPQGIFVVGTFDNRRPLGILGVAQMTSGQGFVADGTNVTALSLTITVPASRRIVIHLHTGTGWGADAADSGWISQLLEDGVFLEDIGIQTTRLTYAQGGRYSFGGSFPHAPSAGTHTYNIRMGRYLGGGNIQLGANSTTSTPVLWVEDIGST